MLAAIPPGAIALSYYYNSYHSTTVLYIIAIISYIRGASIIPIISSVLILPNQNILKINIFVWTIIAALIIQIVTNYINDLFDFIKGADKNRIGPARMLQSGLISTNQMQRTIIILICIGIGAGIPLVIQGGIPIIIIGLSSFVFAFLYTGGPFPLAYHGLGDVFVFIYFGLIAVLGSYYLQTEFIDINAMYLGISIGAKNVLLLIVNNIRDYKTDKIANKKTLIVLFGLYFGKIHAVLMLILSYISIFILASNFNQMNIFYFTLIGLPFSVSILYDIMQKNNIHLNKTLGKVSKLLILDCILLSVGIYI